MTDLKKSYNLDASFFTTIATVHYPFSVFPALYEQLEEKLPACSIVLQVILDEIQEKNTEAVNLRIAGETSVITSIKNKSTNHSGAMSELKNWFQRIGIAGTRVGDNSAEYKIYNDLLISYEPKKSDPKSISQNDLLLVAYSKEHNLTVVTYEKEQNASRRDNIKFKRRYKIPLICYEEGVRCITAVEYFTELGIRI